MSRLPISLPAPRHDNLRRHEAHHTSLVSGKVIDVPTRFKGRELPLLLLGTVATLGGLYIALVPPGLPYDEPSHWLNVLHIVHHGSLPHIGDADVTYEAQMGPLAYLLAAFVAWPFSALSDEAAFYAVRTLGLVEHLGLTWIMWVLIRRALPSLPRAASAGATVIGLSPMLLAMGTSVQNDTLALLLALAVWLSRLR